jgi:nitrous oxide reductase accessory protein NosL
MKKLILSALACTALVISSCNQNSPAPAPAAPTPAPTSSMTATEALLVGDWIWDKTEVYGSGNLSQIRTPATYQLLPNAPTTNNMYAGSHMVLKSSFYNGVASTSTAIPQF